MKSKFKPYSKRLLRAKETGDGNVSMVTLVDTWRVPVRVTKKQAALAAIDLLVATNILSKRDVVRHFGVKP